MIDLPDASPDLDENEPAPDARTVVIADDSTGARLDRALAAALETVSRARLQALLADGRVSDGAGVVVIDAARKVKAGETYVVAVPPPEPSEPSPEAIPLSVVHEDEHLIVIDKPAGLVVHPAAGHASGTLVNALLSHCGASLSGIGGVRRPGIVHRLDKDTSGLLVVAKSDVAHRGLSEQFASHGLDGRLRRIYRAYVWGRLPQAEVTIDAALGRSPTHRTRMAVLRTGGRRAVTHAAVVSVLVHRRQPTLGSGIVRRAAARDRVDDQAGIVSELEIALETGRTHQIRVHLAHIGHPVLGDATYGAGFQTRVKTLTERAGVALAALGRQALHAEILGFEHPVTGERLEFRSKLPGDLQALAAALSLGADEIQP
jgi:23S rRNA pseudouridine1911/1915/1917 synthase